MLPVHKNPTVRGATLAEKLKGVPAMQEISYRFIKANDLTLQVAEAGPRDGSPVILLHGFPDASFGWEKQIKALAGAGFYVIAPDQRGYNLSDKPKGKENYRMSCLKADVLGLADALHIPQFNLAGHDFGGLVSWNLVDGHPERIKRLAILNVPHPKIMNEFLKTNRQQRTKSWYAFFFRLPTLPEIIVRMNNWKMLSSAMAKGLSEAELNRYRAAWSQPGAISAMINWYRCLFQQSPQDAPSKRIRVPTLMVWGKLDPHIMWQMAPGSIDLCENGRLEYLEDATHWVHKDRPEIVNRLLIDHFAVERLGRKFQC
jgi:pimeloyl-ACP methyl ester carboxylesterase